ncbi:MAG TPA: MauE/DoxX family redox-associated membrane protein [Pyrinomonadaceae bacterium]|nr:MauE/DoxX family redox-associated membrane protein [Pyrinomonadaceae bacterium]
MTGRKLFRVAVVISRFGLAALFLFTAGAKLWIIKSFAANVGELVSASGFAQSRWTWPATIGVIVAEIITTICLLLPRTVRLGAIFAAAMLIGFSAFALYYRYGLGYPEGLECGCFGGIIASQLGVTTALRNLLLLLPTLLVWSGHGRYLRESAVVPANGATA